jgi:hypothetical protein
MSRSALEECGCTARAFPPMLFGPGAGEITVWLAADARSQFRARQARLRHTAAESKAGLGTRTTTRRSGSDRCAVPPR